MHPPHKNPSKQTKTKQNKTKKKKPVLNYFEGMNTL